LSSDTDNHIQDLIGKIREILEPVAQGIGDQGVLCWPWR
jgi:hypothetical protein